MYVLYIGMFQNIMPNAQCPMLALLTSLIWVNMDIKLFNYYRSGSFMYFLPFLPVQVVPLPCFSIEVFLLGGRCWKLTFVHFFFLFTLLTFVHFLFSSYSLCWVVLGQLCEASMLGSSSRWVYMKIRVARLVCFTHSTHVVCYWYLQISC